jgi:thioredoxin-like negative regulator of GroEL
MFVLPLPPAIIETQAPEALSVLLDRARKARDAGRLSEAIQAYDAMLAQVPDHETALLERAETLGWAGRYGEAREGYLTFRKDFPAQTFTADLALARLAAWQDHTTEALAILDPWVRQEKRQALLDSATYLSWSGRLPESLTRVRRWLLAHPEDREAGLLEAKVLSWAGRNAEAREAYGRILKQVPGDREALAGLARLSLWEGDAPTARRVLDRMPADAMAHPESQLLLAQVEAAEGHSRSARQRANALARGGPAQRDAEDLRDDLIRSRGPWVELSADRTDTSEGLRTENPGLRARVPLGNGSLDLGLASHRSDFQGSLRQPSEASLGLSYPLGGRFSASGSLTRLSDVGGEPAWGYALGLGYAPVPGLDLNLSHERSLALFTPQAVVLRIAFVTTDLGSTWRFGQGRHALSAGLGQADVSSNLGGTGQTSTRHSHMASYEYRFPVTALDLRGGLMIRGFSYSPSLPLGFFNPEKYRWSGAFGSASWKRGHTLEIGLGAQAGNQTVNSGAGQFTWSYRLGVTWSPRPWPIDLSTWWSQSVAGLPVTTPLDPSAYREHTLGASIRIRGKH